MCINVCVGVKRVEDSERECLLIPLVTGLFFGAPGTGDEAVRVVLRKGAAAANSCDL